MEHGSLEKKRRMISEFTLKGVETTTTYYIHTYIHTYKVTVVGAWQTISKGKVEWIGPLGIQLTTV